MALPTAAKPDTIQFLDDVRSNDLAAERKYGFQPAQ
jgi:hypothetical protein